MMKEINEYCEMVNRINELALNWEYVEKENHEAEVERMTKEAENKFNELTEKYGLDLVLQEIMS